MNDPDGRYAPLGIRQMNGPDGKPITYLERRFVADPDSLTLLGKVPTQAGDRIDLFSARVLGVSGQWWQIADAHYEIHADELEEPIGKRLNVPLPGSGEVGSP